MVEQPHQHLLLLVQLGLELLVQPADVDKQLHLLLLVQLDLELLVQLVVVDKQQQDVDKQPTVVDKQLQILVPVTHIHLLQVHRTVSIVIVFVMEEFTRMEPPLLFVVLVGQDVLG